MKATVKPKRSRAKPSQWRLSTLFVLMLGFSVLFTGVARLHGRVEFQADFGKLPENDASLERWLKETFHARDLKISRTSEKAVAVSFSRPIYSFQVPSPPWDRLGYATLGSFVFRQDAVAGWWIPIGILIIGCAGYLAMCFDTLMQFVFRPRQIDSNEPHSIANSNR